MLQHLDNLRSVGVGVFPLEGKAPALRGNWKRHATTDERRHRLWFPRYESYGIHCLKVAVIDTDSPEMADWWARNMPETPWTVKTPRGGRHFYYAGDETLGNAQSERWDVRAGGKGYAVGPGSRGGAYQLVGEITLDLPRFDPQWMPRKPQPERKADRVAESPRVVSATVDSMRRINRARAYGTKIVCILGSGIAHNQLYRYLCWMRDEAKLTRWEAETVIREWNRTNCKDMDGAPAPFSPYQVAHKFEDVYGK